MSKKYTKDDIRFELGCFDNIVDNFDSQEDLDNFIERLKEAVINAANSDDEALSVDFDPEFEIEEEIVFTPDNRTLN